VRTSSDAVGECAAATHCARLAACGTSPALSGRLKRTAALGWRACEARGVTSAFRKQKAFAPVPVVSAPRLAAMPHTAALLRSALPAVPSVVAPRRHGRCVPRRLRRTSPRAAAVPDNGTPARPTGGSRRKPRAGAVAAPPSPAEHDESHVSGLPFSGFDDPSSSGFAGGVVDDTPRLSPRRVAARPVAARARRCVRRRRTPALTPSAAAICSSSFNFEITMPPSVMEGMQTDCRELSVEARGGPGAKRLSARPHRV